MRNVARVIYIFCAGYFFIYSPNIIDGLVVLGIFLILDIFSQQGQISA